MHTQCYNPVRLKRCFFNAEASSEFSAENFYRDFEFVAQAVGFLDGIFVDTSWLHTTQRQKIWLSSGINQFDDMSIVIIKVRIG